MVLKDFNVAIVGGGIVGLVCAIGLANSGVPVEIFEAASQYGEVGAGIGIGPNALRILHKLGILNSIVAYADDQKPTMRFFKFRRGIEPHDTIFHYPGEAEDGGLGLHRAHFLKGLAANVDRLHIPTHFNRRCSHITSAPSGKQCIHFTDGTTYEADMVIGADGVKSTVRRAISEDEVLSRSLVFTNTVAYRGLVPAAELEREGVSADVFIWPICWFGPDKHLITFPIKNSTVVNVVVFVTDYSKPMQPAGSQSDWPTWVQPATQDEMISHFSGWGHDVQAMLHCIKQPNKWFIHGLYPPLATYTKDSVVLIGDAAHAMLPHLGAGAGAGIEDAYVLSQLISHSQVVKQNLRAILSAYNTVRVQHASFIALASKVAGDVYEGHGPSGMTDVGRVDDIKSQWDKIWHYNIEDELYEAEKIL